MTRVSVEFDWQSAGAIRLDDGRPAFPALPSAPGLYRFIFEDAGAAPRVYIGESDNLKRRAQNYRTPGRTQQTNVRMNAELLAAIAAGVHVSCATVTAATISLEDGASRTLDLSRKTGRLIVENAAMSAVIAAREADPVHGAILVNRPGVGEAEWA